MLYHTTPAGLGMLLLEGWCSRRSASGPWCGAAPNMRRLAWRGTLSGDDAIYAIAARPGAMGHGGVAG